MQIRKLAAADFPLIEDFLARQEFLPIQQAPVWGEFQKSLGNEVFRVGAVERGVLLAYAQIFVKKLPLGFTKIEAPRAPLGDSRFFPEILAVIEKVARKKNALFTRFDFPKNSSFAAPKLQKANEENFPLATLVLNLTQSEQQLLSQMKPKGRYNIRVAEKHGVEIAEENSREGVETFAALLQKTAARDGFSAHPRKYYERLLEVLGTHASLLVARREGIPLAALILTFAGDTATYYYGASDHEFRNLMAPYLLQFSALRLAKKRGCRFYDLLGVAPTDAKNHKLAGVSEFKRKLGGEIVEYPPPKVLVLKPTFYRLFKLTKKLRR